MATENDWQGRVKRLLKGELARRGVSYRELAERLGKIGVSETEANIANKISRGGFSAVFLLQCLDAIECRALPLSVE